MRSAKEIDQRWRAACSDASPPVWWWLSFSDPDRPKGSQFLGVAIVRGSNIVMAAAEARRLGCNPGGEVMGETFSYDEPLPDERFRNRLLSASEADECEADRGAQ